MIEERLIAVEERLARALARSGRRRDEITLVAVTKMFPASVIRDGYAAGLRDFGENYVQEFAAKLPELADLAGTRFHLIGHLQSNKAKPAAEMFNLIQTVDSGRLARRLDQAGLDRDVMIEVKLSAEQSKHGAAPEDLARLAEEIAQCPRLVLRGLMTMPPWSDDAESARPYFVRLRRLAEELRLPGLSMGMSHDFEVAIEEGATHVRVGSALFGPRRSE
jgi:hypothetical protein